MPAETVSIGRSDIAGRGLFSMLDEPTGSSLALIDEFPESVAGLGLINHSCDPNLAWKGHFQVALRGIAAGDELTLDYATCITDPDWSMYCHCETYRCRQLIEGSDWQIPQLQTRYAGHWVPAIQRMIDRANRAGR